MPRGKYIRSPEWKAAASKRMQTAFKDPNSIWNTPEIKKKMYKASLGKKHSADARERHRQAVLGKKHPMWGKHHTEKTKEKIGISSSKMWKDCNAVVNTKEYRKKLSNASSGENHHQFGIPISNEQKIKQRRTMKKLWRNPKSIFNTNEYKEKRSLVHKKHKNTVIELKIKEILDKLNIEYEPQMMQYPYNIDFYIPSHKLAIEADGTYSHGDPSIYGPNDYIQGKELAKDKWKKDKDRNEYLEYLGYTVIRFWEKEIKKDIQSVEQKIKIVLDLES